MSSTATPWTDANEEDGWNPCGWAVASDSVRKLELETNRLDHQLNQVLIKLGETQEKMFNAERQRDSLADGLKWIAGWNHQLFNEHTAMQMRDKAEQTLTNVQEI